MGTSFKSIAGRGGYLLLGVVLLFATIIMFKITFSGNTARTYSSRKTEKSFLYAGVVLAIATIGCFGLAFDKPKKWNKETEVIKPTGKKINSNPEVVAKIENFKIEPLMEGSVYQCIRTSLLYHGEQKDLTIYIADDADYIKIAQAKSINISGALSDDSWSLTINNARLTNGTSTIIT